MANKIKDTDYLAISARVRAMETTLLTAERMERLLEARSDEEVSKLLQDCVAALFFRAYCMILFYKALWKDSIPEKTSLCVEPCRNGGFLRLDFW